MRYDDHINRSKIIFAKSTPLFEEGLGELIANKFNPMKQLNFLYCKISLAFLLILGAVSMAYNYISHYVAEEYVLEINQKLYGVVADSTAAVVKPMVNGEVDKAAIKDIMHSMMVINPSVEVYLLDTAGIIITYVAPNKKIKLEKVDLEPVKAFIAAGEDRPFLKGDDPRNPLVKNIFSAAPILEKEILQGYVYIILASEEQMAVVCGLQSSYMYKLGKRMALVTLLTAMLLGLLALWYLTRSLSGVIETVERFKEGDYTARIAPENTGDLVTLADTFNGMADQIVTNIEELKSVENLRRELIANVSHDLRTPLAIMQGYVETMLMKNGDLSKENREKYLEIVLNSSQRLSTLIAQLFEYSKLEARQIEAKKEPFYIGELAQDVFATYQILTKEKNIELALEMPTKLPMVFADLGLVERVIQNLMYNAVKFTPNNGKITLELNPTNTFVEIKIADTGPGISEEDQSHIFDRYRKATRKGRSNSGAGLGLAIAKKILELHDASIRVQSKLNEGTAFMFQLPTYT